MAQFKLFLFGPPRIEQGERAGDITLRKALALLAYLAVTKQPHSRDSLATLFWPETGQREARAGLRRTLYRLHEFVPQELVVATSETVTLHPQLALWSDVAHFRQLMADALPANHPTADLPLAPLTRLIEAANLYRADFMAGFTLPDSPAFDEWQFFQREALRRLLAQVLAQVVCTYQAQEKFEQAIPYARRWLALDPLHEPVQRQLMHLYVLSGQPAAALRQYQECVRILNEELGVPPEEATTALFEAIKTKRLPRADKVREWQGEGETRRPEDKQLDVQDDKTIQPTLPIFLAPHLPVFSALRHNLPAQPTPFVGRASELAAILDSLQDPACRLLTLVGPGGMGKTRLALAVAQQILDFGFGILDLDTTDNPKSKIPNLKFPDGLFFIALATVNAPDGLAAAIAAAVNFSFYSDAPPEQQLLAYLGEKQMLLILDNFEHLLAGANFVSTLLTTAPALKIIVTSREALPLQEAWFRPLVGLACPTPGATLQPSGAEWDAVQLFVQCARRACLDFDLAMVQDQVVQICQLVGGMPLAIELAAAWLKVLTPETILHELQRGLDLLTITYRNVPDRHRSMRLVLEQSWQMLNAVEQGVLRRLAVFRGGFSQAAAAAVAGATLFDLARLVEKALLQVTPTGAGAGRYQLHELLRQYSAEQLAQTPAELSQTQAAHSRYFIDFLHARQAAMMGGGQVAALAEIASEYDNVKVAWQWAVDQAQIVDIQKAAYALYMFYECQSKYLEGTTSLAAALRCLATVEPTEPITLLRADLLTTLGWLLNRLGRLTNAKAVLQEAQTLYEQQNHWPSIGMIPDPRAALGINASVQGDYATAIAYAEQVRQTAEAHNHPGNRRLAYYVLAGATLAQGDYRTAQRYAEIAYATAQTIGDRWFMAYCLNELGHIARALGDVEQAHQHYETSYELRKEFADPEGMAVALSHLGGLALQRQAYAQAQHYYQESMLLYRDINDKGGLARVLHGLGSVACAQQQLSVAQPYLWQALHLAAEVHFSWLLFMILVTIGDYLIKNGQTDRGLPLLLFTQHHPTSPRLARDQAQQLLEQYQRQSVAPAQSVTSSTWASDDLETVVASLLHTHRREDSPIS
jgi:predicted ATPase/DNA-binding SARP family transcriptional activator